MAKEREIASTEKAWLEAIVEDSSAPLDAVRSTLLKYGVRAQSTPPRAKKLRFSSIRFSGVRAESDRDGPFAREWKDLGPGLWAAMSDRNLRGKSSILNLLYAALRGEFPGRVKSDVWKWLEMVEVAFTIDGVLHRTELHKPAGEENPARSSAKISRTEGEDLWVDLYDGDGGEGLKSEMDRLMMEELDFPIIYAHNKNTGGHQHGWPAISSSLFMSSSSEAKSLFGDIYLDALPLRLLQLFIGLPWVSTYSAALTASKQLEQGRVKVHQGGADDYFSNLTMGERLRIKIAVSLAAVEVAKRRGHGRHPGLLVIDSPASEEVVDTDFEQMLDSVSSVVSEMADVQVIIGTTARPSVLGVVSREHRLHAMGDDYLF